MVQPSGRRASITGRGLDVWEVIATIRDNDGSIATAALPLASRIGRVLQDNAGGLAGSERWTGPLPGP